MISAQTTHETVGRSEFLENKLNVDTQSRLKEAYKHEARTITE